MKIATKKKLSLAPMTGIARTGEFIAYRPHQSALALLDYDTKGMPEAMTKRIADLGGFWPALVTLMPELEGIARITRMSTSSGLYRTDTGERLPGSSGVHVYLQITRGEDIAMFLQTLHERC